jgi:hypothetical protein
VRDKQRGWGIPAAYVPLTMTLGMALPRLEARYFETTTSAISVGAMMSICSAITSGTVALTGIVFSLAFVMVQFSATAYSPRLVLWVARDKVLPHSLGMFTATFLYALIERLSLLQVNRMLVFTADRGRQSITELYPDDAGRSATVNLSFEQLPVTQTLAYRGDPRVMPAGGHRHQGAVSDVGLKMPASPHARLSSGGQLTG